MSAQDQSLYEALQEKFFTARSNMQNDYSNRDHWYKVSQACQQAMDMLEQGKLSLQAKLIIRRELHI